MSRPLPLMLDKEMADSVQNYLEEKGLNILTEEDASKEGLETLCALVDSRSKHGMIPGMKPWKLRLLFDKKTEKLIDGRIISHSWTRAKAGVQDISG